MSNMKRDYILLTLISNISYQYFLNLKFFLNTNNNSKFGNDIHSIENKEKYKYMKKNGERRKKKETIKAKHRKLPTKTFAIKKSKKRLRRFGSNLQCATNTDSIVTCP